MRITRRIGAAIAAAVAALGISLAVPTAAQAAWVDCPWNRVCLYTATHGYGTMYVYATTSIREPYGRNLPAHLADNIWSAWNRTGNPDWIYSEPDGRGEHWVLPAGWQGQTAHWGESIVHH
jgi:hypothetical protein